MHKIESPNNSYIKHLCKLKEDSSYRLEMQKVLVEGKRLIEEILPFAESCTIYSIDSSDSPQVQISEGIANKISPYFAEFPLPKSSLPKKCNRMLALDGVSDPGNLGTLLRTALALGWDGVFLLPGCCDPFNSKALRASKCALFKLPYTRGSWSDFDKLAGLHDLTPLAAELKGNAPEHFKGSKCILILGNEGQGISIEGAARGKKISIPMQGAMESLNVSAAGAILMYILSRS